MKDYRAKFHEFRRGLRAKYSKGEDRIAALEKWQKDHKTWNEDWDRRSKRLDKIWNWGPKGKPKPPSRKEDFTSAQGRMAAAIREIRRKEKGTGKAGDRITRWLEANKALVQQARAERVVPPAPVHEDQAEPKGTAEDIELARATKEFRRIRSQLLSQGREALRVAMRDPDSAYSRQKAEVEQRQRALIPDENKKTRNHNKE